MKTTYRRIKSFHPCQDGWKLLLKNTNPDRDMNKEVDLMDILKSNGIEHTVWALRCFDYLDYCLFMSDIAEVVLPIFEARYPKDKRPRKAAMAIREYKAGKITKGKLVGAAFYASCSASDAEFAANDSADGAAVTAAAFIADASDPAAFPVMAAVARIKKWNEMEQLFIKHFGGTYAEH